MSGRPTADGFFFGLVFGLIFLGRRHQTFALSLFAGELAGSADRLVFLSRRLLRRLFVKPSALHFAEDSFALHFLFQHPKRLVDIVVTDEYLQNEISSCSVENAAHRASQQFDAA